MDAHVLTRERRRQPVSHLNPHISTNETDADTRKEMIDAARTNKKIQNNLKERSQTGFKIYFDSVSKSTFLLKVENPGKMVIV